MRFLIFFIFLLSFSLSCFAQFTDSQKQVLGLKNLYTNGGAESGKTGWSETGGGTLSLESTTIRTGKRAIKFESSATSDYLNFPVVIAKKGTGNCEATIWYKSTSAVFDLEVYINSVKVALLDLPSNTEFTKATATFVCTDYVNNTQAKITNGANTDVIYVDDAYIGENQNIGNQVPLDKQYDISSYVSGFSTVTRAIATPKKDRNNIWVLDWEIVGTTASVTSVSLSISGVTFKSGAQHPCYLSYNGSTGATACTAGGGGSSIDAIAPASTSWRIRATTELDSMPTWATDAAAETVVRAESSNGFGYAKWNDVTSCIFTSTSGSYTTMSDTDCNSATESFNVTSGNDSFEITKTNLKANTYYKVSVNAFFIPGGSTTECSYRIWDGTNEIARIGVNPSAGTQESTSSMFGYITYPSFQASKTFSIQAKEISGTQDCIIFSQVNYSSMISIEEVYPTQSAPVIVNSVITSYNGQTPHESVIIGKTSDDESTVCTTGTCDMFRNTGAFTSATFNNTGRYDLNFDTSKTGANKPNCTCSTKTQIAPCNVGYVSAGKVRIYSFSVANSTYYNDVIGVICDWIK